MVKISTIIQLQSFPDCAPTPLILEEVEEAALVLAVDSEEDLVVAVLVKIHPNS